MCRPLPAALFMCGALQNTSFFYKGEKYYSKKEKIIHQLHRILHKLNTNGALPKTQPALNLTRVKIRKLIRTPNPTNSLPNMPLKGANWGGSPFKPNPLQSPYPRQNIGGHV